MTIVLFTLAVGLFLLIAASASPRRSQAAALARVTRQSDNPNNR